LGRIGWVVVIKLLGLLLEFRFLIGENNYEDVWEDKSLLEVYYVFNKAAVTVTKTTLNVNQIGKRY
jgi:hypothetical protein